MSEPLEIGDRVRYFTPRTCWYHGLPGTVVDRQPTSLNVIQYTVRPDDPEERPMYLCQGAVYGVEKWRPRSVLQFGCPCRVTFEIDPTSVVVEGQVAS